MGDNPSAPAPRHGVVTCDAANVASHAVTRRFSKRGEAFVAWLLVETRNNHMPPRYQIAEIVAYESDNAIPRFQASSEALHATGRVLKTPGIPGCVRLQNPAEQCLPVMEIDGIIMQFATDGYEATRRAAATRRDLIALPYRRWFSLVWAAAAARFSAVSGLCSSYNVPRSLFW